MSATPIGASTERHPAVSTNDRTQPLVERLAEYFVAGINNGNFVARERSCEEIRERFSIWEEADVRELYVFCSENFFKPIRLEPTDDFEVYDFLKELRIVASLRNEYLFDSKSFELLPSFTVFPIVDLILNYGIDLGPLLMEQIGQMELIGQTPTAEIERGRSPSKQSKR